MLCAAVHFSNASCLAEHADYAISSRHTGHICTPGIASVLFPAGRWLLEQIGVVCMPQHVKQQFLSLMFEACV
jgi:hypothetical protein